MLDREKKPLGVQWARDSRNVITQACLKPEEVTNLKSKYNWNETLEMICTFYQVSFFLSTFIKKTNKKIIKQ